MIRDKLVDEINKLFASGYNIDYPPLNSLLKKLEDIDAEEECKGRIGEVM
jgi:hypothetical protein